MKRPWFNPHPRHRIRAIACLGALVLVALFGYSLAIGQADRIEAVGLATENLARLLDEHAAQSLRRVEGSLARAARDAGAMAAESDFNPFELRARLRSELPADGMIRSFSLIDANGSVLLSTDDTELSVPQAAAQRDYFLALRERAAPGMVPGAPVRSGVDGKWLLPMAMRLPETQAPFPGVLVALVESTYFERIYDSIDTGKGGFVTLFLRQGWIAARVPFDDRLFGRNWADSPMFSEHLPRASSDTLRQVVVADGVERIYSYRALPDYPVVISVGQSLTEALAPWRARAWRDGAILLLVLAALGAAVLGLDWQLRRRAATEKLLRRLSSIVETTSDVVATVGLDGQLIYLNASGRCAAGIGPAEDLAGRMTQHFYPPECWAQVQQVARPAALRDGVWSGENELVDGQGRTHTVSQVLIPHFDANGDPEFFTSISRDISERKRNERLLEGQKKVLEMIALGAPLEQTLATLIRMVEGQSPGMLGSVLLLDADGQQLHHVAAPSLPEDYIKAIGGLAIGEGAGSCGTAAFRRAAVIVLDIASDPLWDGCRERALQHGLRACWSTPILDDRQQLLGTFAMYARQPGAPGARERWLIAVATQAATVAITRQRSEIELRQARQRLEIALEGSQISVWEFDLRRNRIWIDAAWSAYLGGPLVATETTPDLLLALVHPDDRSRIADAALATAQGAVASYTVEHRVLAGNGEWKWIVSRGRVIERNAGGRPLRLSGTNADITERKRAEQDLERQSERLRIAQSAARMVVVDWHIGEDRLEFSDSPEWLRGPLPAQGGRYPLFKDQVHPEDRASFLAARQRAIDTLQGQQPEFRLVRTDGEVLWLRAHQVVIADAQGKAQRLIAAMYDITAQKRGEQVRLRLEAQLRQAQKMEALGTLAGGIAHDFNNMLASIYGNVALARQDLATDHPIQLSLDEIGKASLRARDLVQQILAFSRQQPQQRVVLDLCEVTQDAVSMLRASLPSGIELLSHCAAETPAVLADRTQMHQVMMNLGTNAWHAIGKGAGRIELVLAGLEVHADRPDQAEPGCDLPPGRYAHLSLRDSGMGMDAATLERIFEPFFTTKGPREGTGLGLAVVDGIVKSHGGIMLVQSEPGQGSIFHLYFPAVAGAAPEARPGLPMQAKRGAGQRILYLDDEESLVLLARRLLGRLGYQVDGYTDAALALAAFAADPGRFDLLVTDQNMPRTSGLEVAAEMLRQRADLPVALASGYVTDELRAQALALGIREVIYKPNTVENMVDAIHRMLVAPAQAAR